MNSIIINTINRIFEFSQNKCAYLWENSFFLKNIDNLIFATIIGVFILSTFASSDVIGYVSLITLFLTVIKLFIKKDEKIEPNLFEYFLLVYFLLVVVSLAGSSLFSLSFKGFLKTFTYLGFYFSAVQYYKNNLAKIPFTIFVIAMCAASQGIIGIFQNFSQVGEISTWQDVTNINPEDVMTRVYGTLQPYNPNLFGGYLIASLPCLFGAFFLELISKNNVMLNLVQHLTSEKPCITCKNYFFVIIYFILICLTSFALILSGCRGAYIGFLAMMVCFFVLLAKFIWCDLENKKEFFKKLYLSFLTAVIAFSTCVVLFVSSIRTRFFSIFAMRGDSSTSFRFNVYQSVLQMIKDNWLLGIGVGNQNFREIYGLYMRTGFDALSCYSVFLEIAVESGIFALIAFLGFLAALTYQAITFILNTKDLKSSLIVSTALVCVIAVMVHGLVDTIFFRPQIQFIFWTMVSFVSAVGRD
ncbi:MAG: O-antigen ligase family protein [Candidatus Gastranaerophilales bacterium]|nr:O-antigen ligase family protein [Candidatus Gastranaerophilales bacterium]